MYQDQAQRSIQQLCAVDSATPSPRPQGQVMVIEPQSLEILTNQGKILTAADAFGLSSPAPNVGQYDLTPLISRLSTAKSLKLSLPLQNKRELALKIAPKVLSEWKLLTQEIES